jgi:hypothetical protein
MRDWQKICERTIYRPHSRKKFGMVEERGIFIEILRGEVMWRTYENVLSAKR